MPPGPPLKPCFSVIFKMEPNAYRCGYVAIVGRSNVGKSTLMNRLLGQKISITSRKPQTTRHRILGIKTGDKTQVIYVDTPGFHLHAKRAINRYMNRAADTALPGVDVVVFMLEATRWTEDDDRVLQRVLAAPAPLILAVNKVDRITDKGRLLPYMAEVTAKAPSAEVIPLSARNGDNLDVLEQTVISRLPESEPVFPEDQVTDRSMRFLAAELVREKLTRKLGEEVPYGVSVEVENYSEQHDLVRIDVIVWVETSGQKAIVIGKQGRVLKNVGIEARRELEATLEKKVFLRSWVKLKENWPDNELALKNMGYAE